MFLIDRVSVKEIQGLLGDMIFIAQNLGSNREDESVNPFAEA